MAGDDHDYVLIEDDRSRLPLLKGKRVRLLVVYVRRPSDAQHIAACAAVDNLQLWGWKQADFAPLGTFAVERLRLVRGRQTSLRGLDLSRLRHLWLQDCRSMVNLSGFRIPSLTMDACNRFDLDSLGAVEGLLSLDIQSHKRIDSLEFVRGCRCLRRLAIGTYSLRTRDFSPIMSSPTLELVICGWLKKAEMEAISRGNPRLFVSSPEYNMVGGVRVSESYSRRLETVATKYGFECG